MHGGHSLDLGPYWEIADRWQDGDISKIHCDCCPLSVLAGAAVAFGLMGMAHAIKVRQRWREFCAAWDCYVIEGEKHCQRCGAPQSRPGPNE